MGKRGRPTKDDLTSTAEAIIISLFGTPLAAYRDKQNTVMLSVQERMKGAVKKHEVDDIICNELKSVGIPEAEVDAALVRSFFDV